MALTRRDWGSAAPPSCPTGGKGPGGAGQFEDRADAELAPRLLEDLPVDNSCLSMFHICPTLFTSQDFESRPPSGQMPFISRRWQVQILPQLPEGPEIRVLLL